tara:strand:+ start:701 stop:2485 length:1785 start_codon:yes stop_codon:yes gene_type:complete
MADCSELALAVTDIVTMIASENTVKNLDDVVTVLKTYDGLDNVTREEVVGYIVEASQGKLEGLKRTESLLSKIKREAKVDSETNKRINKLQTHIKNKTLPEVTGKKNPYAPGSAIAELRAIEAHLKSQLSKSEPAQTKRLDKILKELNETAELLDTKGADGNPYVIPVVEESSIKESHKLKKKRFEVIRQRALIREKINALKPKTKWGKWRELFDVPRALVASFDYSAPGRQGKFFVFARPLLSLQAGAKMFKATWSPRYEQQIMDAILNDPEAGDIAIAKLYLAPTESMGGGEHNRTTGSIKTDDFRSDLASKLRFGIGKMVRASNRAYNVYLNSIRVSVFNVLKKNLTKRGEPTIEELQSIANFVNVATGRGARVLGEGGDVLFFSQRYTASRIQLAIAQPLLSGSGKNVKMIIAKEYARMLLGAGTTAMFASMMGVDIELDPRSSDFMKMRFGKHRVDLFGGMQSMLTFGAKAGTLKTKSATTGEIKSMLDYGQSDLRREFANRFFYYKLSPFPSSLFNMAARKDVMGENRDITTLGGAVRIGTDLVIPLSARDIARELNEEGIPLAVAYSLIAILGNGVQSFENENPQKK